MRAGRPDCSSYGSRWPTPPARLRPSPQNQDAHTYQRHNSIGANASGQFSHIKEDLLAFAQESFGISPDLHAQLLSSAIEEKAPQVISQSNLNLISI